MKKPKVTKLLVLALLASSLWLTAQVSLGLGTGNGNEAQVWRRVVAPQGSLTPDGTEIILWHDYGSFALYRVSEQAWHDLPPAVREQLQAEAQAPDRLWLGEDGIDTSAAGVAGTAAVKASTPAGKSLFLVQFVGPIKDEWLAQVAATGAEPVHYIADNGYLLWADAAARQQLRALADAGDVVQFAAPYADAYKVATALQKRLDLHPDKTAGGDTPVTLAIQMLRHAGQQETEQLVQSLLAEPLTGWEPVLAYQNMLGTVAAEDLARVTAQIAARPDVVWVGEFVAPEMDDEVQGQILAAGTGQAASSGPGYLSWLVSRGFSEDPLAYPIVDITDDGIGNGIAAEAGGDVTLRRSGLANENSRLAYISNCTAATDGSSPDGHGHLNLSIAGGYDLRSGFPFQDSQGYRLGLGINPFGRFAGTRVFAPDFDISRCGNSYRGLVAESYRQGARIISNSWGCHQCAAQYDLAAQAYDAATRDADPVAPGNQEVTILFSSGNKGPASGTVGSPGNGKNMITVGASENLRPDWQDGCGLAPTDADNVGDMARFSSRGPAPGGRVKPDLVAPGTHIQGTASSSGAYNGSGVCDAFWPQGQRLFAASSGTSHAAPAVAGAASLTHYWLREELGLGSPSPALVKAYLLANTRYLGGEGAADNLPSNSQGYGLPDLQSAFGDTPRVVVDQTTGPVFDESGETWTLRVAVADPAQPVRIVVAYSDYPGAVGTQPQVNDLDLAVSGGGSSYRGNNFTGAWSTRGGRADRANNVEAVFLPAGQRGTLEIGVTAYNIAGDGVPGVGDSTDQDFALVCVNCRQEPDFTLNVEPVAQAVCGATAATYAINVGMQEGFGKAVALRAESEPVGAALQFSPAVVTVPGSSILTVKPPADGGAETYRVTVHGEAAQRQHQLSLRLELDPQKPAIPRLTAPADGASQVERAPVLSWTDDGAARSYIVEIARDASFRDVVERAKGVGEPAYTPERLESGRDYYWRVRAENACGTSAPSAAFVFDTATEPGSCPGGVEPSVAYSEGFENETHGWTATGRGSTWARSDARPHEGGYAAFAQSVDAVSDQYLLSPPIGLPRGQSELNLQFWNYQSLERDGEDEAVCYDGATVEISTNDGMSWSQLAEEKLLTDPYDGVISDAFGNPLGGRAAWCADPQDWLNSVVSLDDYAGRTVRLRFRLATDQTTAREGWFVDDVRVTSCPVNEQRLYLPLVGK